MQSVEDACHICKLPSSKPMVQGSGFAYHAACFRCQVGVERVEECGEVLAGSFFVYKGRRLCEKDFHFSNELRCTKCRLVVKGPYIKALGHSYHVSCFSCSLCARALHHNEAYFEWEGKAYCAEDYGMLHASRCAGCEMPVRKSFVEVVSKELDRERWHPDCFLIFRRWSLKLGAMLSGPENMYLSQLRTKSEDNLVASSLIFHKLATFEDSCNQHLVEMLQGFYSQNTAGGVVAAENFIRNIHALFREVDMLEGRLAQLPTRQQAPEKIKGLKTLSKNLIGLLAFLSIGGDASVRREKAKKITAQLTILSHCLKVIIRETTAGFVILEFKNAEIGALEDFLERLNPVNIPRVREFAEVKRIIDGIQSHVCAVCDKIIVSEFYKVGMHCMHTTCSKCAQCESGVLGKADIFGDMSGATPRVCCKVHAEGKAGLAPVELVSKHEQFVYLLRISLRRLCYLLSMLDSRTLEKDSAQLSDIFKSSLEMGILGPSSRPTETSLPRAATITSGKGKQSEADILAAKLIAPKPRKPQYKLLPELSPSESLLVKEVCVNLIYGHLGNHFTLPELRIAAGLQAEVKVPEKTGFFSKFLWNEAPPTPLIVIKEMGVFGVPLQKLVEMYGEEATGGYLRGTKIPHAFNHCIETLMEGDLTHEGLFRKNGNIGKLKVLCEEIEANPTNFSLVNESSIQIAVLLKKLLRDLPEPLLTFALHPLFVASQKHPEEVKLKKHVLHLILCLLPKPNIDLLLALCILLSYVASFSATNLMDERNLATVFAPNVLHSRSRDPLEDEPFYSIEVLLMIIKNYEDFVQIPKPVIREVESPANLPPNTHGKNTVLRQPSSELS